MSMPSGYVRCHGCNFEGIMQRRPIAVEYVLPGGEVVRGYRRFAWCSSCENVTEAEEALDTASIRVEIDSLRPKQVGFFTRIFGGGDVSEPRELEHLQAKLRLAQLRKSCPRCLKCGGVDIVPLAFDAGGTSNVTHTCGRCLFAVPDDPDAPRFTFKPEVIRVDPEGRRL